MTLPLSGTISLRDINVELGKAANAPISFNDADVRALAGKPSGIVSLSDFYGKTKASSQYIITGVGMEGGTSYYGFNEANAFFPSSTYGSSSPSPLMYKSTGRRVKSICWDDYALWVIIENYQDVLQFNLKLNGNIYTMTGDPGWFVGMYSYVWGAGELPFITGAQYNVEFL